MALGKVQQQIIAKLVEMKRLSSERRRPFSERPTN